MRPCAAARRGAGLRIASALVLAATLAGCATGRALMPTPVLYTLGTLDPFEGLPPALAGADVDVLYVTDREPGTDADGRLVYGIGRSP
jgi:hypothetical protein